MSANKVVAVAALLVFVAVAATGTAAAQPGEVDGYEPDDTFDFEKPLEDEEVDAVVSRTMARVEEIRDREFEGRPSVRTVNRSEAPGAGEDVNRTSQGDWNDVVWEALLIVGDDKYANQAIADTVGGATAGFYEPGEGSDGEGEGDGTETVSLIGDVDESTLAHELVHVMQDQHYNLSAERFSPPVQDEQMASQGVVEGEADYIRFLYERRCSTEWQCYRRTDGVGAGSGGGGFDGNVGILMTLIQPYSDGPEYVHRLREEGGWEAVEEKYDDVPTASSEIIHHEEFEGAEVGFENTATEGWSLYEDAGKDGYDVAGEASIFASFLYQSAPDPIGKGLGVIDTRGFLSSDSEYSRYDYTSEVSEGWRGDRIYPYHRETEDGNETGFVWKSVWETEDDAKDFADAYMEVLEGNGGERIDAATLTVDGDFRGAYRIGREGSEVTVVHAPTTEEVKQLRPSVSGDENPGVIDARPAAQATPGFGVLVAIVALAALLVASVFSRRRS